jgi:uncharacterized protein YutE (UPF0331/DUF86 family)
MTHNNGRLKGSVNQLKMALEFYAEDLSQNSMRFLTVSKAFDVAVKCAWEDLSQRVEAEGVEIVSPKDAIRQAAKMKIIKSAEDWLDYINTRNSSVHDYFGISQKDFVELARKFLREAEKVF